MQATRYLEAAMVVGMQNYVELHERWVRVMHDFGGRFGVGQLSMAPDTRMDMLLRTIEDEAVQAMQSKNVGTVFGFDIQMALSEQWVLSTYESIRTVCKLARNHDRPRDKLLRLRHSLELVRMPIAKHEIANPRKRPTDGLMLVREGDGPETAMPYVADGSYMMPKRICTVTGSVIWLPIDIEIRQTVWIRRRDISDAMLSVLD